MSVPAEEPVEVRRPTGEEWADLRAVRLAMLLDSPLAYGSTYARERGYPESLWRERAAGTTWLAWRGDQPVGAVTLYEVPGSPSDETRLVGMWVAPHARGEGVADLLVETAVEHVTREGLSRVLLDVATGNERARAAYRRLGFVETGRERPSETYGAICETEMVRLLRGVNNR